MAKDELILSKYYDDFLEGSKTIYNYTPASAHNYLFYSQIVGIQNIGPKYYNELARAKEYQIQYTIDGEGSFDIEDEHFTLKKGDLIIIPNYYHHIFRPIEGKNWKIAFVHIYENNTVVDIFKRIFMKCRYIIHDVDSAAVLPFINRIMDLAVAGSDRNNFRISEQIYGLLMNICEVSRAFDMDNVDNELAGVVHFLKQNYTKSIKISDILQHSSYSKNHLERLFKQRMNMTMQQYISHLRLTRAQDLILQTNIYYKEIAEMVGLSDYRALVYLFRNSLGITPSEYRKKRAHKVLETDGESE